MSTKLKPAPATERPDRGPAVLERKDFNCRFKALDDTGSFELYAAVFGNIDRQDDVIIAGAFKNLDKFVTDGWGALNHVQCDLPVAWIETAVQDEHGLKVTGRFHSTPEAQACRTVIQERMAAGKSVKCSIGYLIVDAAVETRDGRTVRLLKAIEVFEFSFVNLPANPEAGVLTAKSLHQSTNETDAMTDTKGMNALEALKSLLGLSTKGRMSAKSFTMMKACADAMSEHHEEGQEKCKCAMKACKEMSAHHGEGMKIAEELHKCLKTFGPKQEPADDEDEPEDDADKPKGNKARKDDDDSDSMAAKDDDPQDSGDGDPPKRKKRKNEDEKAFDVLRDQLKRRSVIGRRIESCP
jgi:HK97 family phage prohead protease